MKNRDTIANAKATIPAVIMVGVVYYFGAWLGVNQTISPEGIAILWPPNAVVLAAFLLFPSRYWLSIALVVLVAEVVADTPSFPFWSAVAFGFINISETLLAARLLRYSCGSDFDFDRIKRGALFLLFGPGIASLLAALLGAAVYLQLGDEQSSYWTLWRLWWFGDALGLLLLTPPLVLLGRWIVAGKYVFGWQRITELVLFCLLVIIVGDAIFTSSDEAGGVFHITPVVLLPFAAFAAVRYRVGGATLTVLSVAAVAVNELVNGRYLHGVVEPQQAVWLIQEYLAIVAVLSIGLAIMLHEIAQQREQLYLRDKAMRASRLALQKKNEELESRVAARTRELQQANARLQKLADIDALTGVANRRHFEELAGREMTRCKQAGTPLSLVMFDLDHFKGVNDRYGHEVGDRTLIGVVETVLAAVRPLDRIGRFGGEEFMILLPQTDAEAASAAAERVRLAVSKMRLELDKTTLRVTASFGVVQWNGSDSLSQWVAACDARLYQAKEAGRNCVR